MGHRRTGRLRRAASFPRWPRPLPDRHVRDRERQPADFGSAQKEQTLEEVTQAVTNAKKAGIEIVHGFLRWGTPMKPWRTCRRRSSLRPDCRWTFGFNRLCVYRGTPLWQEYVKRGLVNDATDWYKYFKCSEIDPTCLPGEVINRVRQQG